MSTLVQICFVIVTIAVVAIAVATIRVMKQFSQASEEFSKLADEARQWIDQLQRVTREADQIVGSLRGVIPRVQRVVEGFESIGQRATRLSDSVLHEVEIPVRTAVAVARGVRTGTTRLLERVTQRLTGRPATNGGWKP